MSLALALPHEDLLSYVMYQGQCKVPTTHPQWINVMDKILPLSETEKAYFTVTGRNEGIRRRFIRPEQKSVGWIENIANKFSKLGNLSVDLFFGTFGTARSCLMLPRHRRFVDSEVDAHCFAASTKRLV